MTTIRQIIRILITFKTGKIINYSILYILLSFTLSAYSAELAYTIMPDRFFSHKEDISKNGISEDKFKGGTIKGIIEKLPYIKSLGVTRLFLTPIVSSKGYHGYHTLDPFKIKPELGTLEDYKELISNAHELKIKIYFDLVMNHIDENSKLYKQNKSWFINEYNNIADNSYNDLKITEKMTFFEKPDFDFSNQEVIDYFYRVTDYWLSIGVDGFRLDGMTLIPLAFWKSFYNRYKEKTELVGEIYVLKKKNLDMLSPFVSSFPYFFLRESIVDLFENKNSTALAFELSASEIDTYLKTNQNVYNFINNHDLSRFISEDYVKNKSYNAQALALMFCLKGIPSILYGDEIGLKNSKDLKDTLFDKARSTMTFVKNSEHDLFKLITRLNQLRDDLDIMQSELNIITRSQKALIISYTNHTLKRTMIFILNRTEKEITNKLNLETMKYVSNGFTDYILKDKVQAYKNKIFYFNVKPNEFRILTSW